MNLHAFHIYTKFYLSFKKIQAYQRERNNLQTVIMKNVNQCVGCIEDNILYCLINTLLTVYMRPYFICRYNIVFYLRFKEKPLKYLLYIYFICKQHNIVFISNRDLWEILEIHAYLFKLDRYQKLRR